MLSTFCHLIQLCWSWLEMRHPCLGRLLYFLPLTNAHLGPRGARIILVLPSTCALVGQFRYADATHQSAQGHQYLLSGKSSDSCPGAVSVRQGRLEMNIAYWEG
jgi:hypothetical protein